MADNKLTDQQVTDLITALRGDGSLDSKVQFVTTVKSGIKQHNVPEASIPLLFEALRTASTSQHAALVNAGFTALNHLLTRLSRQEPKHLAKEANRTLPLVIEKLGDQKDKFRSLANHSLVTLFAVAPTDVERFIRTTAMGGKNPRAKEAAMSWLLQMHNEQGLPFRAYVPTLMELLEDADGMVRDAAKTTVIELFRTAPNTAKSDLKRQLKNFKVRPAIEQAIVKELAPSSGRPITPAAEPAPEPVAAPAPAAASRPIGLSASVSSLSDRPTTPSVDSKPENLDPVFVNTNRELDDIFKEMAWFFEGRETEQNWLKREEYIGKLRRLNVGNAPNDFAETFLSGLRSMLDGIIKSITSLRTSLSKEGCALVQDMAATFGPAMDPMVELLMQTLIKLSAGTKKISSQLANVTVDIILSRVSYTPRLMQHIWGAFQDKNVAPRTYATGWLKTILKKEAQHKGHVEHTGGLDLMDKCLRKGLGDANPAVREKTRSAYWAFAAVWPARAEAIMEDLDGTAQKLLNKDPNNPNGPKKGEPAARPGLGLSKSTMGTSKPSLRETMMAQRKANLATKNIPPRPGSAMSHFSPVKTTSGASTSTTTKPSTTRTRPESSISVNAGGMSGAPMRPTRKRGDIPARPATAGPYSVRGGQSSAEIGSPESTRSKNVTPKRKETTPRRTGPRTRPGHMSHASESSLPSPSASRSASKPAASPRVSPAKLKQSQSHVLPLSSPARANESFSIVVPSVSSRKTSPAPEEQLESPTSEPVPKPEIVPEPEPMVTDPEPLAANPEPVVAELVSAPGTPTPAPAQVPVLQVYEDPFVEEQQPVPQLTFSVPVLEDKPVNADAAILPNANGQISLPGEGRESPDKFKQSLRLLDSGIARIQSRTLDVHGFRKLQSLLRESKGVMTDDKFEALLVGLFEFLEDALPAVPPEKAQDIKAQILATIKLLLRKERDNFHPHVSKGLESILETRSAYETRAHIVSGLEVLADELVTIGDGSEMVVVLTKRLEGCDGAAAEDNRILSTGLHVLRSMLDKRSDFVPSEPELGQLTTLASRCLGSADSGVRMDAVQLCVAIHSRVGEGAFWAALKDVKDDPKSLITYYIVKRQREQGSVPVA